MLGSLTGSESIFALIAMILIGFVGHFFSIVALLGGVASGLFFRKKVALLVGGILSVAVFSLLYGGVFVALQTSEGQFGIAALMAVGPLFAAGMAWAALAQLIKGKFQLVYQGAK